MSKKIKIKITKQITQTFVFEKSVDFVLLFEYIESLLKQPVDLLFMDKFIVVNNSACLVDD